MSGNMDEIHEERIREHILAGRKIEAIKYCREHCGMSLEDAKDFVDLFSMELREQHPEAFPDDTTAEAPDASGGGCLGVVLLVVLGAGAAAVLL